MTVTAARETIMDAIDTAALSAIAEAITEVTGNDDFDSTSAQAAQLAASSRRVMYAALCYTAGSEPRETLTAAVRDALR
jgi:hypothetical protein